jgi:hypothetical protein
MEGLRAYGALFEAGSPFWERCQALLRSSWEGLLAEKAEHGRPGAGMLERDDAIQRSKVNWLKVAAVAVTQLAGRRDLTSRLLDHLDHWQSACQMMDDFDDRESDLAAGNHTRLHVLAGIRGPDGRNGARLERFFGSRALADYFEGARDEYERALDDCPRPDGHLADHIESLLAHLEALRAPYEGFLRAAGVLEG